MPPFLAHCLALTRAVLMSKNTSNTTTFVRHGASDANQRTAPLQEPCSPDHGDNSDGNPPRTLLARWQRERVIQDVDPLVYPEIDGMTVLHQAAYEGNGTLVEFLVQHGAAVNIAAGEGLTPLMAAAQAGHLRIVEALIQYDVQVDDQTNDGQTALDFAIDRGHTEVATSFPVRSRGSIIPDRPPHKKRKCVSNDVAV